MTLFTILICLGLQHYLNFSPSRAQAWLNHYYLWGQRWLKAWGQGDTILGVCLLLIPLLLIIGGLDYALNDVWVNSLQFLFHTVILFFCLDARSLQKQLADYLHTSQHGNEQSAFHYGLLFLRQTTAQDANVLARAITERIFLHADVYLFAVIFWYVVSGPAGAVVYAATRAFADLAHTPENSHPTAAQKIQMLLDWIPARLTALSYALVGHFGYTFAYLRRNFARLMPSGKLSYQAGLAAMEQDENNLLLADYEENQAALDLVNRGLMVWIVIIALCTLAAWIA